MKELVSGLLLIGLLLMVCYTIDAIRTKDPNRRKRDVRDIRIIGAAMNAIK